MKRRPRKLKLRRETVLNLKHGRITGGEFTFGCSADNRCDTGFRECTIDYLDTNGSECDASVAGSVCITCPHTGSPTVCGSCF